MDLITSRPAMTLRGFVRRLRAKYGILNRALGKREKIFERELIKEVRTGDIAWDVGAFVGKYTEKLSCALGPDELDFTFEPIQQNRVRLQVWFGSEEYVAVLPVALGDKCESANLRLSLGRSRVVSDSDRSDVSVVRMATGDAMGDHGEAAQ